MDSRDDVDGGSVTTNPNTTSVGKLRYMANALHYASKRTKAVHDMSEMDHECLGTLNAGELKTLLVASVELVILFITTSMLCFALLCSTLLCSDLNFNL